MYLKNSLCTGITRYIFTGETINEHIKSLKSLGYKNGLCEYNIGKSPNASVSMYILTAVAAFPFSKMKANSRSASRHIY